MTRKLCLTLIIINLTACSMSPVTQVTKPIIENQRTYALSLDQAWDVMGKKLADYVGSTTSGAFKSELGCGGHEDTLYGTDLVSAGCPNNERSIFIYDYQPKNSTLAVCQNNPALGRSPALKNGTILIVLKPSGSNTIVSVHTSFGHEDSKLDLRRFTDDYGNVGVGYGIVKHAEYCYSTGIIERSILDLIQSKSASNAPATLAFAEGLITAIPEENLERPKTPSTATKKDIKQWRDVAEDTKNNLFLGNREGKLTKLGVVYAMGYGVQKDEKDAVKWFTKAASYEKDEHDGFLCESVHIAEYNLGVMYENGLGVTKSDVKALEWYTKAEAGGNSYAKLKIGYLYANGLMGLGKNKNKATELFTKLIQGRNNSHRPGRIALRNMGFIANGGLGDPKVEPDNYLYYAMAAREGDTESQMPAEAIKATLTSSQVNKAQELLNKMHVKGYNPEFPDADY